MSVWKYFAEVSNTTGAVERVDGQLKSKTLWTALMAAKRKVDGLNWPADDVLLVYLMVEGAGQDESSVSLKGEYTWII